MKAKPESHYSFNEKILFIRNFDVRLGVTGNNFGSTQLDSAKEPRLNRDLLKITQAHFFAKIKAQHGDKIIHIEHAENAYYNCDALIACLRGLPATPLLIANTADCPIISITDRHRTILALIHSGWKGSALNIVGKTVQEIIRKYNINPVNLDAYVWPGICKKHYFVGPEFKELFPKWVSSDFRLNLKGVIIDQLLSSGLLNDNIYASRRCSYCSVDNLDNYFRYRDFYARTKKYLFYSFRRSSEAKKIISTSEKSYDLIIEANQIAKRNCVFLTVKP